MGLLAFLADGHAPGRGRYGVAGKKALDYVLRNARPSGLLNIAGEHNDMYNHGLSTFVLGQAYGMTGDPRVGPALDRALKVIDQCQCQDGGWDYEARAARKPATTSAWRSCRPRPCGARSIAVSKFGPA